MKMTNAKMDEYFVSHPEHSLTDRYLHYVSLDEMRAFIGLMILVGVFRASRDPLESLFSEDLNFGKPIFRATMPRERMKTILRFLRFDDPATRIERVKVDKLAPIRYIFDLINDSLNSAYHPGRFTTIDEHLCRYRGRCKFRQFMPNKPDKYGLKFWVLADARNYYPLNIEVYTGKNILYSNKSEDVTMRLTSKLSPGHVVVGDNYFTSLHLTNRLFFLYNCIEWGDAIIVEGTRIEKRRRDVKLALNLFVITILRYCFSV